jgi:hypothetical protein
LDLREQERRWKYIREGRYDQYHGIAIHPRHLSVFEWGVLRLHRMYDPSLDDREERLMILDQLRQGNTKIVPDAPPANGANNV